MKVYLLDFITCAYIDIQLVSYTFCIWDLYLHYPFPSNIISPTVGTVKGLMLMSTRETHKGKSLKNGRKLSKCKQSRDKQLTRCQYCPECNLITDFSVRYQCVSWQQQLMSAAETSIYRQTSKLLTFPNLKSPTGLLLSTWIHLLIIDTCISKHLNYLCCKCIIFSIYTWHLQSGAVTHPKTQKEAAGSLDKKATGFLHRILENSWK